MTLPRNSTRFIRSKRILCFLTVSLLTVTTYSQQDSKLEELLLAITNKHDITYDSFSRYGDFYVFGEKGNEGELETYKAVTVIGLGSEDYWIIKSEKVSYDPNTTVLDINDCMLEKFINDSKSLDPVESYKHINFTVNTTERTSTMIPVKQDQTK